MLCKHGCGREIVYEDRCDKIVQRCPAIREKNSIGLKRAHSEGRSNTSFGNKQNWAKGRSKYKDSRLMNRSKLNYSEKDVLKIYNTARNASFIKEYIEYNNIKIIACGHETWNGKKLTIHLHHKNSNRKDWRKDNLEFLCPNCHSLTENYAFKGRKHGAL